MPSSRSSVVETTWIRGSQARKCNPSRARPRPGKPFWHVASQFAVQRLVVLAYGQPAVHQQEHIAVVVTGGPSVLALSVIVAAGTAWSLLATRRYTSVVRRSRESERPSGAWPRTSTFPSWTGYGTSRSSGMSSTRTCTVRPRAAATCASAARSARSSSIDRLFAARSRFLSPFRHFSPWK